MLQIDATLQCARRQSWFTKDGALSPLQMYSKSKVAWQALLHAVQGAGPGVPGGQCAEPAGARALPRAAAALLPNFLGHERACADRAVWCAGQRCIAAAAQQHGLTLRRLLIAAVLGTCGICCLAEGPAPATGCSLQSLRMQLVYSPGCSMELGDTSWGRTTESACLAFMSAA